MVMILPLPQTGTYGLPTSTYTPTSTTSGISSIPTQQKQRTELPPILSNMELRAKEEARRPQEYQKAMTEWDALPADEGRPPKPAQPAKATDLELRVLSLEHSFERRTLSRVIQDESRGLRAVYGIIRATVPQDL
jgi:hypothetical protein